MSELKPCPFCGGAAEMEHSYHEDNNRYPRDFWHVKVSCSQCYMASTGWNSYGNQEQKVANFHIKQQAEQEAAAEWNRRPTLTPATDVEIENAGMISSIREFGAQGDWIAVRINDDGWDVLTAEASRTVLRPTPATDDRANIIATADRLARRMGGEFVLHDDVGTRARELWALHMEASDGLAKLSVAAYIRSGALDDTPAFKAISAALRTADAPSDEGRDQPFGSKTSPGNRDCLAKALPDEPMFIILARDPDSDTMVDLWARRRSNAGGDEQHCSHALAIGMAMRRWRCGPTAIAPASAPAADAYPAIEATRGTVVDDAQVPSIDRQAQEYACANIAHFGRGGYLRHVFGDHLAAFAKSVRPGLSMADAQGGADREALRPGIEAAAAYHDRRAAKWDREAARHRRPDGRHSPCQQRDRDRADQHRCDRDAILALLAGG